MIVALLEEAVQHGARRRSACAILGVSARMVERWRCWDADEDPGDDLRHGPTTRPTNALSSLERERVLTLVNSPRFRELSPKQIVPRLADEGTYVASESTVYRILRAERLLAHRGRAKAPERRGPNAHVATGPNQVWSWDITYLKSPVRGWYFYLYLIVDIWSRQIMGWAVYTEESAAHAAALFRHTCTALHLEPEGIVLHADNGGPMTGATMVATLESLGVLASFSRPRVSDDNPYSEALFRTLKYRPDYPPGMFADLAAARAWVAAFVTWYNTTHLHSGIRFMTPADRHAGRDQMILARRRAVYECARTRHPERWTGCIRTWEPVATVYLNPPKAKPQHTTAPVAAA
jgi:putative transposase